MTIRNVLIVPDGSVVGPRSKDDYAKSVMLSARRDGDGYAKRISLCEEASGGDHYAK